MRMIDLGGQGGGPIYIIDTPTAVDCTKDVGFRRSFRSLVECMVPCCAFQPAATHCSSTVMGTFFGYRRGRVSFCLQDDTRASPLLLLELAVPTVYLAREMQHGLLRIALECDGSRAAGRSGNLFGAPAWSTYCNGRKVGFAVRRPMSESDSAVFKLMESVSVGAGVLPVPGEPKPGEGEFTYLRASFKRVVGSADSESFHMINPGGGGGQELSIFLLRS